MYQRIAVFIQFPVGHIWLCVPSGSSWVSDTVPYQSIPNTTSQQQAVAT